MPPKLIRLLVAFALALSVPLQGLAAATAELCMALGDHGGGTAASHAHDGDAADHQHDHHAGADDAAGKPHCPPCCAAAAISPSSQVFLPEAPAASPIGVAPPSYSAIQPDKLDRPPLAL